jgi:hypothetical protein
MEGVRTVIDSVELTPAPLAPRPAPAPGSVVRPLYPPPPGPPPSRRAKPFPSYGLDETVRFKKIWTESETRDEHRNCVREVSQ